jgi:hypothetical protein
MDMVSGQPIGSTMINGGLPRSEQLERIKTELSCRETGSAWFKTAAALEELFKYVRGQPSAEEDSARKIAEAETRLTWGLLARYLSVMRRLRTVSSQEHVPIDQLLSNGFNAVEIAVRIYERSRTDGLLALRELNRGDLTLAQVRHMLKTSKPGRADESVVAKGRLLRKRSVELERVDRALERGGHLIFGAGCRILRRPALRFFRRVGVEARIGDRIVGGADILTPDASLKNDPLEMVLPTALLLAEYLPIFYLIFSPGSDDKVVQSAKEALDDFNASVGIFKVSEHGQFDPVRQAGQVSQENRQYDQLKAKLRVVRKTRPSSNGNLPN